MARWAEVASLADQHKDKGLVVILANPFAFSDSTYPKVLDALEKEKFVLRKNLSFLKQTKHPKASRDGYEFTPGWNSSNAEIQQLDHDGCYLLFGRDGDLIWAGRETHREIESRVDKALRRP